MKTAVPGGASLLTRLKYLALAGLFMAASGHAQQPAKLVVGLPAGGSFDTVARIVAEKLPNHLERPVVVENRPGAQTRIAIQAVKGAAPDGSSLLVAPGVAIFLYPHLFRQLNYDPFADLKPVTQLVSWDIVLAVAADSPVTSFNEFQTWARQNPDKAFYGTSGTGSLQHFLGVSLARRLGTPLEHIAFKGGKDAVTALLGGHINAIVMDAGEVVPLAQAGKLRVLATFSAQREPALPQTPTMRELGLGELETSGWAGLYAPAGTPEPAIRKLNSAVNDILALPDVAKRLSELGMRPAGGTPQAVDALARQQLEQWRDTVAQSGFVVD
ncbi:ABC transporter substrate-binding protein [Achromobacter sp. ACM03]|uniref:Bug family tripartite tricarboxylate transporter substrate binding protein n=1 Tax=Achromobacter TaxID=222 RepID=UPI0014694FD8|nr:MULTISPECIES: tripartite tricarboxylate transporter substrate-binding protein [Achromobacter]MBD9430500.1 ABC transporter substrate-binding protein [Achromobacter sp. ACM03]MBD9472033.1 ABC transporter substrate-binding protein [Achromobacter sp. ACM01]CAB3627494.1 hypothetical protein LMG26852_00590 [Achromobacter aegrifaciens]CAB3813398.1 hypothetical protein LMG26854_00710 [Achromobacter aegrifaciens]CAB3828353.1 hypothetical protein LMG3410_00630 [Achromobacter aegrifaciens]